MKKTLIILIVLGLVAALMPLAAQPSGKNIAPKKWQLKWNPPGKNFQAEINTPADVDVLNGYRIAKDDVFTLKVTYTTSRDCPDGIGVGFSDMNPWAPLTWRQGRGGQTLSRGTEIPWADAGGGANFPPSKAGVPVSATVEIKALARASGAGGRANTFILATFGNQADGPIDITFTEFVLTKK